MKKIRKLFSLSLCVALILTTMSFGILTATAATEFAGGSGTQTDPYLIATKEHLNNVRNYLGAYFKMIATVEFTNADFAEDGVFYNDGKGWEPIGSNKENAFTGTFDGNNFTIKNLYVKAEEKSTVFAGLFGYIDNGTVENLGLINLQVSAISTDMRDHLANTYAGGISGFNKNGTITNCYISGKVNIDSPQAAAYVGGIVAYNYDGKISNCYNKGAVSATSAKAFLNRAGGIVGSNTSDGIITNCYNMGSVKACYSESLDYAGGIAGSSSGTITGCYNKIDKFMNIDIVAYYAGGIVGNNTGTISNCYNTGDISGKSTAGGISGKNEGGIITNCYNTGNFSGAEYTGGIVGLNQNSTITNCYNAGRIYGSSNCSYTGGIVGRNYSSEVKNCYNAGNITSDCDYYSSNGRSYACVGGIIGGGGGTIENCYNFGSITVNTSSYSTYPYGGGIIGNSAAAIKNCYNIGSVSARYRGGIAGENTVVDVISNCYYLDNVYQGTGGNTDYGIELTLDEMKKQETFVGFDFDNVWKINDGDYAFPQLRETTHIKILSIKVTQKPSKLTYLEGEDFDTTGMVVTAYFENDISIELTDYTVNGYSSTLGTKTITVSHSGKTASFTVTVENRKVTSIAVTTKPTKLTYLEGESFDSTGIIVTAYYNDNTSEVVTDYNISGYTSTPGTKTITVTFDGKTTLFTVTVNKKTTSSTHASSAPQSKPPVSSVEPPVSSTEPAASSEVTSSAVSEPPASSEVASSEPESSVTPESSDVTPTPAGFDWYLIAIIGGAAVAVAVVAVIFAKKKK